MQRRLPKSTAAVWRTGLLVIQAEGNVLRFVPPLIVEEKHIDKMIGKLRKSARRIKRV